MNIPEAFRLQITKILGSDACNTFLEALAEKPSTSLRINPNKKDYTSDTTAADSFIPYPDMAPVPWGTSSMGYHLAERPSFTMDPHFHAGRYYVQEASSMLVGALLGPLLSQPVVALDLCAAPGGKSTDLLASLPKDSILLSNEVIRSRAQILRENMIKWGNPNHIVSNNDPADFAPLKEVFDVIVTDVPCSGEGMFRKDANAINEWSPEHVDLCVQRQRRILTDIWGSLRPGGFLLYSTCTYNLDENEHMVQWIAETLGAKSITSPTEIPDSWGVLGSLDPNKPELPVYRCMPHKIQGEGFFCAILQKTEDATEDNNYTALSTTLNPLLSGEQASSTNKKKGKNKKSKNKGKESNKISPSTIDVPWSDWVVDSSDWQAQWLQETLYICPKHLQALATLATAHLRVLDMGIAVASIKGKSYLPHHALAMSTSVTPTAFPIAEVDEAQAIAYLRHEAIVLENQPKGFVLIANKGSILGFVKNIGNRANNLYPNEWRIRKQV